MRRSIVTVVVVAGFAAWSAFAQDATPTTSTTPENPSETDDVTLVVRGFFPSTDYAVTGSEISRFDVPAAAAHGANEVELTATVRYRFGPTGTQVLTPYEARIPIGRFSRFTRIKVSLSILCQAIPCSPWFSATPWTSYVYVRNPEPPRLEVQPAAPLSTHLVR